jgi:hypothetical protein
VPQSPSSGTHTLEQRRTLQIAPHLAAFPNETWLDYVAFSAKLTETSSSWLLTDRSLSDGRWPCSRLAVLAAGTQRMSCCTRQAKSTHAHLEPFGSYEAGGEGVGALAEGAWLVKFYTEKCGHCRRLQPSWEALGGRDAEERGYSLGSLDCKASDEHLDACAKMRPGWQGHGWPAVVVMMNGRVLGGMKRYSRIRDVEPQQGAKILDGKKTNSVFSL